MSDKARDALIQALKTALSEPGEQRLYRAGKLPGLFPTRTGANSEAAAAALREGLLEVVRREERGKVVIEWVRMTPKGVEFLHQNESPQAVLEELRNGLKTTRAGIPLWLDALHQDLSRLIDRMSDEVPRLVHRLDVLTQRVEEALRRLDASPALSNGLAVMVPWGLDALTYLDRRRASGAAGDCPLPELFDAVRRTRPELSVDEFHDGLRRLRDARAVRLTPQPPDLVSQPEYALPDGPDLLYFAGR